MPSSAQSKARAQRLADGSKNPSFTTQQSCSKRYCSSKLKAQRAVGKKGREPAGRNAALGDGQVLSPVTPTGERRRGLRWVRNTSVGEPGSWGLRPCNKVLGPQMRKSEEQTPPAPSHPPPSPLGFHLCILYVCSSLSACTSLSYVQDR